MLILLLGCKPDLDSQPPPESQVEDSAQDSAAPRAETLPMPCENPASAWSLEELTGGWALPDTRDGGAGRSIHNPVALADLDGDGDDDLILSSRGQGLRLYLNTPEGWSGGDLDAGLDANALALGDLDGDRDLDLVVAGNGKLLRAWLNDGAGGMSDFSEASGLASLDTRQDKRDLSLGDLDGDGDLDLFVTVSAVAPADAPDSERHKLLQNDGAGHFADVSSWVDPASLQGLGWATVFTDYDQDGDPDLYTVTAEQDKFGPSRLLRNDGAVDGVWQLSDQTEVCGCDWTNSAMGVAVGDYDGDSLLDLYLTSTGSSLLLKAVGDGSYYDVAAASGAQVFTSSDAMGWGNVFQDLNNDGWLDLYVTTGRLFPDMEPLDQREDQRDVLLMGDGQSFVDRAAELGVDDPGDGRGAAYGLIDGDGFLDLVMLNVGDQPGHAWRGACTAEGRSLVVELRGAGANTFGIGARVELETDARTLVHEVSSDAGWGGAVHPRAVFGLGELNLRRLRVIWPGGAISTLELAPQSSGRLLVEEP